MVNHTIIIIGLLAASSLTNAFWRMSCSTIQTGRIDPIVNPGTVAGHVHKVSGASNFGLNNTFADLRASRCTSCEIQDDKSAYWTPQLYYQHTNGSFQEVPNGGTVVYYLGRGDNRNKIEPFPPGFKMLSGDSLARSNDTSKMTYSDGNRIRSRLVSDRVSFACLDSSGPMKEQNYMFRTDCNQGMRAQIHFQSCWDGRDYQTDQSHVAYMSQIDNGVCPPTHPRQLVHLFFEVIYGVNDIDKSKGGSFVFSNGDKTGFGFHADFMNGWDQTVLTNALNQCANDDTNNGQISKCAPLAKSQTPYFSTNCPERRAIVNEPIRGMLANLPGCNNITSGPARAVSSSCPTQPSVNNITESGPYNMLDPAVGDKLGSSPWSFAGCVADNGSTRALDKYSIAANTMTIDACASVCKAKGYPLAGLEFSRECYCSDALSPPSLAFLPAAECKSQPKMICAGNATQWCGAPKLLTVWNDTSFSAAQPLAPGTSTTASGSAVYLGCFTDGGTGGRTLPLASFANDSMTVDRCAAFCQAGNYALAGVEYGRECYCGNALKMQATRQPEGECGMACKGDGKQVCGGGSRVSVWNNTLYVPTRNLASVAGGYVYQGCYTEGSGGRALAKGTSTSDGKMTVEMCGNYCAGKGFGLMGVEYGQECWCSNGEPANGSAKVGDGECGMTCKGNITQWCGGSSRINVYKRTPAKRSAKFAARDAVRGY